MIGSVFHETLEWNYRQKIDSHEDLPLSNMVEYLHDAAVPKVIENAGGEGEVRWDDGSGLDAARADSERVTAAYRNTVTPRIQPARIEQRFEVAVAGLPVPIIGYLDTITDDQRVIDTKTGKRVEKKVKPSWQLQGLLYASSSGLPVEFHSVSRAKTPNIVTAVESDEMTVWPSKSEAQNLNMTIVAICEQIQWLYDRLGPEETWPTWGRFADWSMNMLPCNFCAWRRQCPAWQ